MADLLNPGRAPTLRFDEAEELAELPLVAFEVDGGA
jgi:hypothetical protein